MRRAIALITLSLLSACESAPSNTLAIELVTPEGGNPVAENGGNATLIYRVEQDGSVETRSTPVGSSYGIDFPITSLGLPTRIHIAFDFGDDQPLLVGATPYFYPLSAGVVRIPVGELGSCSALLEPRLSSVRLDSAAFVDNGHRWLVFGGATASGSGHDTVGVFNPLWLTIEAGFSEDGTATDITPLGERLRDTQVVALTGTRMLVMGDAEGSGAAFFLETQTEANSRDLAQARVTDVVNAGSTATLVARADSNGAAIVGGGSETGRSDVITWIRSNGEFDRTTNMMTPRRRPAVASMNGGLLIAGGQAEGQPELEFVPYLGTPRPVSSASGFVRERPAIVIGGEDAVGDPLATTVIVRGCPEACAATDGPTWERPRRDPTVLATEERTWLLGGSVDDEASTAVDVVVFAGTEIQLEQGRDLQHPRARGTAVELDSGIVVLLGGESAPETPLQTLEMCWPSSLEGVDFP